MNMYLDALIWFLFLWGAARSLPRTPDLDR